MKSKTKNKQVKSNDSCQEPPPPIAAKSKKTDMWEEVVSLRDEIDSQQRRINELTESLKSAGVTIVSQHHELREYRSKLKKIKDIANLL
jgi:septal ring factor EnvC (AmiA/AmiB activator)